MGKKKIIYFENNSIDQEILYCLTSGLCGQIEFFNVPINSSDKDLFLMTKECLELEYFPILKNLDKSRLNSLVYSLKDDGIDFEVIHIGVNKFPY